MGIICGRKNEGKEMLTDKLHGRRNVTREQPKRIHKLFHLVCCVLTFILSNKWLQQILLLIAFETNHFLREILIHCNLP